MGFHISWRFVVLRHKRYIFVIFFSFVSTSYCLINEISEIFLFLIRLSAITTAFSRKFFCFSCSNFLCLIVFTKSNGIWKKSTMFPIFSINSCLVFIIKLLFVTYIMKHILRLYFSSCFHHFSIVPKSVWLHHHWHEKQTNGTSENYSKRMKTDLMNYTHSH